MHLIRITGCALLAFAVVACQQDTPTDPALGPQLKKGGKPKPPEVEYQFLYDEAPHQNPLGSDCWKKSPETEFGKTFWCDQNDPTFKLQIVEVSSEGVPTPVETGTVSFKRCEHVDGYPVDWTKCGVLQKRNRRDYQGVDFGTPYEFKGNENGVAMLTVEDWKASTPESPGSVWGMHWEYYEVGGRKPAASIKWRDLAYDGYVNPPPQ
jgi:hypothetical protein